MTATKDDDSTPTQESSGSSGRRRTPAGGLNALMPIGSLTLSQVDAKRRPSPSTVCEICPASVWMASPREVKCYCRIMHLITWSTTEPHALTHCDGIALAEEQ